MQGIRTGWQISGCRPRSALIASVGITGLGGSGCGLVAYGFARSKSAKNRRTSVRATFAGDQRRNPRTTQRGGRFWCTLIFGAFRWDPWRVLGGLALLGSLPGRNMVAGSVTTIQSFGRWRSANGDSGRVCVIVLSKHSQLTTIRFTLLAPYLFMLIGLCGFQSRLDGDLVALMHRFPGLCSAL